MAESKLVVSSMDFAVKVLKLCDGIKVIIQLLINLKGRLRVLVQIFVRQIMLIVNLILFLSCKYRSKNVTKQNTGLKLC